MSNKLKKLIRPFLFTLNIKSALRYNMDPELYKLFKKLKPGITLDIGAKHSPYKPKIPHTKYLTLDIDKKNNPDICSDIHKVKHRSNAFDNIIATEVLEHCYDPQKAINEIYRLLKKGGACILATRFLYPYHADPHDYYRFTWNSLEYLFRKFKYIEIKHHGGTLLSIWELINNVGRKKNIFLNIFNPLIGKFNCKKTICPCGFLVYAVK